MLRSGLKRKKKVSSIWKSMKTKHFLINVGTNILASFSCFPSQAEAWNAASDMPLQVRTLIWCQNVGLQVRERSAVYWSVHGVLIHTIFFPTLVSSCQNAVSEIVERMENVQPEEQKTQKRIRGHDLWMQLIESLLRGKNLAWHYFKGNSNHKWAKVIKEWISAQRWRKRAFPLHKLCLPHLPSHPGLLPESCASSREELSQTFTFFFHWNFPFSNGGPACVKGMNPCLILKHRGVYIKDSIKCNEVTFTLDLLHQDVIILHLASLWANERKNGRKTELLQNKWKHLGPKSQPD